MGGEERFVFLCGGRGKRFEKATPLRKPQMPVYGAPMYEWVLRSFLRAAGHVSAHDLIVVIEDDQRSRDVHRDVRRKFEGTGFRTVRRCTLSFETRSPAETVYIAAVSISHEDGARARDHGMWVLDNDVIHDGERKQEEEEEEEGDGGRAPWWRLEQDEIKIVVADVTARDAPAAMMDAFLQGRSDAHENEHDASASASAGGSSSSPYCHVTLDPSTALVTDLREKEACSPWAVMGAYGFGSARLYLELCAAAGRPLGELALSDVVREAVRRGVRVRPVTMRGAFTVGTPDQLRAATRLRLISPVVNDPHASVSPAHPQTWVFDVDETLVSLPEVPGDYATCAGFENVAALTRRLCACGHRVVLFTARHMKTCGGDVDLVRRTVGGVTEESLRARGVAFHEIIYGKPCADVYVDDRATNPRHWTVSGSSGDGANDDAWITGSLGFGWEQAVAHDWQPVCSNIFRNVRQGACLKVADRPGQLAGYRHYLENAPPAVKTYLPRLRVAEGDERLVLDWIDGAVASKLHAHGLLDASLFTRVLSLAELMHAQHGGGEAGTPPPSATDVMYNYFPKLQSRVAPRRLRTETNLLPRHADVYALLDLPVVQMLGDLQRFFAAYRPTLRTCIHGDYWLGNVIVTEANELRLIDMRGVVGSPPRMTVGGDAMYDYAKLYQSLVGFDHLIHRAPYASDDAPSVFDTLTRDPLHADVLLPALGRRVAQETDGAHDLRTVHNIACALVLGCLPFHRDLVRERPRAWRKFVLSLYAGLSLTLTFM